MDATCVVVLTSSRLDRLQRAVKSVIAQIECSPFPFNVHVMVNTTNAAYETEAMEWCASNGIPSHRSESNGRPGRGHNSVLDLFAAKQDTYKWCIMLDGDDAFYPGAFALLAKAMVNADALVLCTNDSVSDKHLEGIFLSGRFTARINTAEVNLYPLTEPINPFFHAPPEGTTNTFQMATPGRIVAFNRAFLRATVPVRYSEEARLFDDLVAFVLLLHAHVSKELRVLAMGTRAVYLYNSLCDNPDSATERMRFDANGAVAREERAAIEKGIEPARVWGVTGWQDALRSLPHAAVQQPEDEVDDTERRYGFAQTFLATEVEHMRAEARALHTAGDPRRSSELTARMLFSLPCATAHEEHDLLLGMGICACDDNRPWEALCHWRASVLVRPNAPAYMRMAAQVGKWGCFEEAIEYIDRAIAILKKEAVPMLSVEDCQRARNLYAQGLAASHGAIVGLIVAEDTQ